jgi:stage V sporulation protein B
MGDYTATAWLGELNGMAMPLAVGPTVLFGALGTALIPDMARDFAQGRAESLRGRGESAYFWVLAVAAPCACGLWQLAEPVCRLIFPRNPGAALPLGVLAFTGVPLALTYVACAVVNAVGRPAALLPGATFGSAVKSGLVLALTGTAGLGVRGSALGILAGLSLGAGLNVRAASALTGCRPPWGTLAVLVLPAVAVQVLAEYSHVMLRYRVPLGTVRQDVASLRAAWTIFSPDAETVGLALLGVEAHRLSFWDAMLWALAKQNGVTVILSEDGPSGCVVGQVAFRSPF